MRTFDAITSDPFYFFTYLEGQNQKLYVKVIDHLIFEEVNTENYRLRKLDRAEVWDQNTRRDLDLLWWTYCLLRP